MQNVMPQISEKELMKSYRWLMDSGKRYNGDDHPKNLFDEIRCAIKSFPTIQPNAGAVLNQMFFTTGNGYAWEDGVYCSGLTISGANDVELRTLSIWRCLDEGYEYPQPAMPDNVEELFDHIHSDEFLNHMAFNDLKKHVNLLMNLEDCMKNTNLKPEDWDEERDGPYELLYPEPGYAAFFDIPEYAEESFLLGAIIAGQEALKIEPLDSIKLHLGVLIERYKDKYNKEPVWPFK